MLGLGNLLTKSGVIKKFPNNFSFNFDGSNDFLDCGDSLGNSLGTTTALTLSIWVKNDNSSQDTGVFKIGGTGSTAGNFTLSYSGGKYYLNLDTNDSNPVTAYAGFANTDTSSWHHIVAVYNGTNAIVIYFDGFAQSLIAGGTPPSSIDFTGNNALVGKYYSGEWDGLIDEVAIWNTALSADDVAKIASKPVDFSKASTYATDRTSNLKLWLRAGDKVLPESDASIARSDFYTDFDGTNDSVIVEQTFTTDNFAISFWINPDNVTGDKYLFDQNAGLCRSVIIGYQDGHINFINDDNDAGSYHPTGTASDTQIPVSIGEWQHYVMMTDGTKVYGYRNGVEIINVTGKWGASGAEKLWIGQYEGGSTTHYEGKMSNVGIYQTVLDAQTISQMAKSRFTPMRDNRFSVVDFDGSDDYIDCGDGTSLDTTSQLTLSSWVNFNSTGTNVILARDDNTNSNYILYGWSDGKIYAQIRISGVGKTVDGGSYSSNVWYHVVATFDGSSLKIYVDGDLKDTLSASGSIDNDDVSLEIGRKGNNAFHFDGSMSSVAVYSTAKSAEEIYAIYQQGITYDESSLSGLVGYWRMGDDTSKAYPTIADSSSNSNDGTITNGASDDIVQQMVAGYDMGAFESSSEELSGELISNSTFDDSTDWTAVGDFTISNGVASITNASQYSQLTAYGSNFLYSGKTYKLQLDVTTLSKTAFAYRVSGGAVTYITSSKLVDNTFTTYFTMTQNGYLWFQTTGSYTGLNVVIDNVSVKEVLQSEVSDTYPAIIDVNEPVLGAELVDANTSSGWSAYGSNTVANVTNGVKITHVDNAGGAQGDFTDAKLLNATTTSGKIYKVKFNAYYFGGTAPNVKIWTGSETAGIQALNTTETEHIIYYVATGSTASLFFDSVNGSQEIYILNLSTKEVQGNVGTMTNQDSSDLVYSSVLPDQSFLTGVNSAYNFIDLDGVDEYILSNTFNDTLRNKSAFTHSSWIKFDDTTLHGIFGKKGSDDHNTFLYIGSTTVVAGVYNGSDSSTRGRATATHSFSTGTWVFVTVVYDGTQSSNNDRIKIYLNGDVQTATYTNTISSTTSNNSTYANANLEIGRFEEWNGGAFNGQISLVAFWSKALSATEVSAIYNLGRHGNLLDSYSDNLVGNWAMSALDASTGLSDSISTIYDRSGNSNHGSPQNADAGDLKSPPNAEPQGYSKNETNRSNNTP